MIVARGVGRNFGATIALEGVSLTVERGELFALIGPDGAGKSTFFRIVAGLLAPTQGSIERPPEVTFGFVPQRFGLYEDLTVDENLHLQAQLYGVGAKESQRRRTDLLGRVGLDRFRARLAGALSGGMKQKLSLVAALLSRPELLLLDEPTTGVDPVSRREFWMILNRLHHEGMTIILSTPYMDEAEYATRIAFLDRGRVVALGTRQALVSSFPRQLVEVESRDRLTVRKRLARVASVDDVSLFGTRLHVRSAARAGDRLLGDVREALAGLVGSEAIRAINPTIEDVFVFKGEEVGGGG